MYNLFTKWVTLGTIFFLLNYAFSFVEVVTIGGLVAGSVLIGGWTVIAGRLAQGLPKFTGRAAVCAAVLVGVQALSAVLPGYRVEASPQTVAFLVFYGVLAIIMGKFLDSEV